MSLLYFSLQYIKLKATDKDCIGHRLNISFKPFENNNNNKRFKSIYLLRFLHPFAR